MSTLSELSRTEVEEHANAISHGVGAVLAAVGVALLAWVSWRSGDPYRLTSSVVYGGSLLAVFVTSTLYHSARSPRWRRLWMLLDYTAIYLLIAGSYTPFALVTLRETSGWWLLGGVWAVAAVGITLRWLRPTGWPLLSTALYVVMGWGGALGALPLLEVLPGEGLAWLVAGGLSYTLGAGFFLWELLPFNHLVWHLAVIAGASCHYVSIFGYVAQP